MLIVGHQVVVLCLRYLLEVSTRRGSWRSMREGDVANCGVTEYRASARQGGLALERLQLVAPLEQEGAPVTTAPDAKVAAR